MGLAGFLQELDEFARDAIAQFASAHDAETLEAARVEYLGARQGRIKSAQKQMGSVAAADRPAAGKHFNEVKQSVESSFREAQQRVNQAADPPPRDPTLDVTLPGIRPLLGRRHPLTQTMEELKNIMGRLGFSVADGPEIEDERHNFEALNIPPDHPARDPLENFYLATAGVGVAEPVHLLRSQTSTVQIRVMEAAPPPIRVISMGRVYRPDTADATHYPMFHQIEGLLIDQHATMADLKSVLRLFARSYLGSDVHVRFRPSFFPFTEPSVEVDYQWKSGWIEFGGAGMVDPYVLRAVGYDPDRVTGFAFGLGVERLCMRRHGVTDIREFYKNDWRFLRQF